MSVIGCHPMSRQPHLESSSRNTHGPNPNENAILEQGGAERRTFVARSNLFLNFNNRRNIQVGNIPLISPISILSPTSPNGAIFSQIRISPNSLASPLGENGFTLSRRLLGPPDKETETFINTVLELEKEHNKPKQNKDEHRMLQPGISTQISTQISAQNESRDIKYDYNLSDISSNHSVNNESQSDIDYQMSEHSNESSDMAMGISCQHNDQYYELIPVEHQTQESRGEVQIIYSANQSTITRNQSERPNILTNQIIQNQSIKPSSSYNSSPIQPQVILESGNQNNLGSHHVTQSHAVTHSCHTECESSHAEQSVRNVITNTNSIQSTTHAKSHSLTQKESTYAKGNASNKASKSSSGKIKKAPPARNHKCNICGKMFVRPAELQRHVRKHTGERPFKCDDCDMTFMRKDHLTSHQLKHRDQKQFKCRFCDYESNRGDTLKRHCKNKHKNEM